MAAKVSKESVNYRPVIPLARRRCGTCAMFRAPASCTLVRGLINPGMAICDRWAKRT